MKYLLILCLALSGCGYRSKSNELMGQVKKVRSNTPIICPNYVEADISLGVIRNGVGSMSGQDLWLYAANPEDQKVLKEANESGALVKVVYDEPRVTFCYPEHQITHVEIVK